MNYKYLTDAFVSTYPDKPAHMSELGEFVFYRTYSRWKEDEKRRESWKETCRRSIEYNIQLAERQYNKNNIPVPFDSLQREAEELFHNQFNLRQFLSGRTLWVGGGENGVADKYPLANFNCSFVNIRSWSDLGDLFYLLLVGTGVGFKCTKRMAANLAPIRTNVRLIHSEYDPLPKEQRIERTAFNIMDNGFAKIYVGDSKEGWVESLRAYLNFLTEIEYEHIHTIKISYNSVRPKGERLNTFGGTASGHEPLKEMFEGFHKVLNNEIDPYLAPLENATREGMEWEDYKHVRPIHILDMGNLIGNNVVVGGVRRTAEIFLCDEDDWECILAKYGINGIWNVAHHEKVVKLLQSLGVDVPWMSRIEHNNPDARPLHHRRMSNNSIAFTKKPEREMLTLVYEIMQGEGEPGFVNLQEVLRRRLQMLGVNAKDFTSEQIFDMMEEFGLNPCAEILLASYGVCNLTTINVDGFLDEDNKLDYMELMKAQRLSARAGLRMTCVELEISHWDKVQNRDRLLGTSVTGYQDMVAKEGFESHEQRWLLNDLRDVARREADAYAQELRVTAPLLVTTVKPEGTLSQVAGGVSSGLHMSHSPYYIRRIRINAQDPLALVAQYLGWSVNPEVGTPGKDYAEQMQNARTLVIDFPICSGATKTKDDVSASEQMRTYFQFQDAYTEHNSSNTITVKPEEWGEVEQIVWDNWDDFTAVSFLAHSGGSYQLAPYEAITKVLYEELKEKMHPFDAEILKVFESGELSDLDGADGCESGICPIR